MEIVYNNPNYLWNVLSLLLGIAAIILAIHSVSVRGCLTCCTLSFGCGSGALFLQFLELERLVGIRDFAAIEDTLHVRSLAAGALLILVLAINLLALYRSTKKC